MEEKRRASRNRTITLTHAERAALVKRLVRLRAATAPASIIGRTICQDLFDALPHLPSSFVDLQQQHVQESARRALCGMG